MTSTESFISIQYQDNLVAERLKKLQAISSNLGDLKLAIGTNRQYMKQHGLSQNGLPKREFLGVSSEDKQEILNILDNAIANSDKNSDATLCLKEIGEYMLLAIDTRWAGSKG